MTNTPTELWPWLFIIGLGLYHGVNPAMGWLFAVALGLQRKSQRVVLLSLIPIALGHAAAVAVAVAAFVLLGFLVDRTALTVFAAAGLIGWALWHTLYGHRQRPIVGMQTGMAGLLLWSFLMASAHGAGLMLIPALLPLCTGGVAAQWNTDGAISVTLAAVGVHTAALLAAIAIISVAIYNWVGVDFLRRGWINLDLIWTGALFVCGIILLAGLM